MTNPAHPHAEIEARRGVSGVGVGPRDRKDCDRENLAQPIEKAYF